MRRQQAVVLLAGFLAFTVLLCGGMDRSTHGPTEELEELPLKDGLPNCIRWVNFRCVEERRGATKDVSPRTQSLALAGNGGVRYSASVKRLMAKFSSITAENQELLAQVNAWSAMAPRRQELATVGGMGGGSLASVKRLMAKYSFIAAENHQLLAEVNAKEREASSHAQPSPLPAAAAPPQQSAAADVEATAARAVRMFERSIAPAVGNLWLSAQLNVLNTTPAARGVRVVQGAMLADDESVVELRRLGLEGAGRLTGVLPRSPGKGEEGQFQGGFPLDEFATLSAGEEPAPAPSPAGNSSANTTAEELTPKICYFRCGQELEGGTKSSDPFYASDIPQNATESRAEDATLRGSGGAEGDEGYLDEFGSAAEKVRGAKAAKVSVDGAVRTGGARGVRQRVGAFMRAFDGEPRGNASSVGPLRSVDEAGLKPRCGWPLAPCGRGDGYPHGGAFEVRPPHGDATDAFADARGGLDAELRAPLQFVGGGRDEADDKDERSPVLR